MAHFTSTASCEAAFKTLLMAHRDDVISVDLITGSGIMVKSQDTLVERFGRYSLRKVDDNGYYAEVYHNGVRWYTPLVKDELTERDLEILERGCEC